jgi:hypothetical protein
MTPQQIDAMKMALEALKTSMYPQQKQLQAIASLEETLAEHAMRETQRLGQEIEQEPVAKNDEGRITWLVDNWPQNCLLYTTPPQRKPLTEQEIGAILEDINAFGTRLYTFARAIEAAHGIKENT